MARPSHPSGNLPAEATTFVGRRRELGEIRKKLATARVVSLIGPGGVGKTRLAVRVGTELARSFADGAWLVELGEVTDAAHVTDAVLAALDEVAGAHETTQAAIALAWLLAQPTVVAPIASARTLAQLDELLAFPELELSASELETLSRAG